MSRFRRHLVVLLSLTVLAATAAAVAVGAHWPQFGGDPGRSGHQPVSPTGLPLQPAWKNTTAAAKNVRTSIVTTGGGTTSAQRVVFGTENADPARARIHLQRLSDGAYVSSPDGVAIDDATDDPDTFGPSGNVTPVDTSTPGVPGNTFAIHNDDNQTGGTSDPRTGSDIALVQILNATGQKRTGLGGGDITLGHQSDPAQPNTIGFTIESAPVVTPPDSSGTRSIFFTATRAAASASPATGCVPGDDWEEPSNPLIPGCDVDAARRLFRVTISNAGVENASVTALAMSADIGNLNTAVSPALANLKSGDGSTKTYVLLSTTDGFVRAFDSATLAQFATTGDLGDTVGMPSVPVTSNGTTPALAPAFYVAAAEAGTGAGQTDTIAYRITQKADAPATLEFDPAGGRSFDLPGEPTQGLTVTKLAGSSQPGRVVVLTTAGMYGLDADNLKSGVQNQSAATGAARATPASSGDLAFFTRDNGDQVVVDVDSMNEAPSTAGGFVEDAANNTAAGGGSVGQPSVSNRFVQFASDDGVFVYQAGDPAPPPGAEHPAYAIGDATTAEGDSGEKLMTFKVTRFGPTVSEGTVKWSTQDGSAVAGEDYVAVTGQTVTFAPGETEKNISVTILSERSDESDETFFVNLSEPGPAGAQIVDAQGVGVIATDDPRRTHAGEATPLIGISDVVGVEGGNATFVVSLSNASSATVTVDFGTTDGSAKAGVDYGGGSGKLVYAPGQTVKTISVPLVTDNSDEVLEDFFMNLSEPTNAKLADNQGVGFIREVGYELPRVAPRRVTASSKPKRDTTAPFRFVTSGRVLLPSGVTRAAGCKGKVAVQIKAAPAKTISNRRVNLRRNCRYASTVTFKNASRFPQSGRLEVHVRFQGNDRLRAKRAKKHTVRTK